MSTIIELATGSNSTTSFGSGVNKGLAVESQNAFEVKESKANFRQFAARIESTSEYQLDIEKFSGTTLSNGGDLEDGSVDATYTVIDNQSLISFNSGHAIQVGFKLTPKLLRQARQDPAKFMDRYVRKIAFDVARKEDIYIGSVLVTNASSTYYGGNATSDATLNTGSLMTIELFEEMVDEMKDNEYEPTDFVGTAKVVGQLRRDARLLNSSDFSVAIKEDGSTVTQIGTVKVHEIKGVTVLPDYAIATGSGTTGIMLDRTSAFGIVDFLQSEGASPVTITVGKPDVTLSGANYHRLVGQSELEAKMLDANACIAVRVSKA